MTLEPDTCNKDYVRRALEVCIHVGLLILLVVACLLILRPFLPLLAWGISIAIAVYPGYRRLQTIMRGRNSLAAVLCTILLLAALMIPCLLMTRTLVEGSQTLAVRLKEGTIIPPLPPRVDTWPMIGARVRDAWNLASAHLASALRAFAPQIKAVIPWLLSASAGIGSAVLQWILSIIVAGVLLANAATGAKIAHLLSSRLWGERGPDFEQLAGSTIRSVTTNYRLARKRNPSHNRLFQHPPPFTPTSGSRPGVPA